MYTDEKSNGKIEETREMVYWRGWAEEELKKEEKIQLTDTILNDWMQWNWHAVSFYFHNRFELVLDKCQCVCGFLFLLLLFSTFFSLLKSAIVFINEFSGEYKSRVTSQ